MKGIAAIAVIAVLWFILKPLLVGLWKGLLGLFSGKQPKE